MKRKLIIFDLVLAAALCATGWRLRDQWLEARHRERMVLRQPVRPLPPPPFSPLAPVQPVTAAAYSDVAQKMLFTRDRNPTVVIETGPAKPMPPLPVLYGVVDIGDGPIAILSEKAGAASRAFRAGEKIGPFTLAAVNQREIVFDWEGQQVTKKLEELIPRGAAAPAEAGAMTPRAAALQPASPIVSAASASGPGTSMGGDMRACQPGDEAPPGTVQDGYRKVVTESPFGKVCRWEPVRK
ncbi:MAG: hypothetical protein AAB225_07375 [Acidobacteriota bacterium]